MEHHVDATLDRLGRPLQHLRLSVTDRCNFRCIYCMPRSQITSSSFTTPSSWLTREEIDRLVDALVPIGLTRLRITGGEPLLRPDVGEIIGSLRRHRGLDLAMTTNGSMLASTADQLAKAGLDRITVSLDSLDEATHLAMSDSRCSVNTVLSGISAAARVGLSPIKVNAVIRRGMNDAGVLDLARHFRGTGVTVRFIEYMDVGSLNDWTRSLVVPSRELADRIDREFPLEAVVDSAPGEVARRWRYRDGAGEVGFISSVTEPFCGSCVRARVSVQGILHTCLFSNSGFDLRPNLRTAGASLSDTLARLWTDRRDRYSEQRSEPRAPRRRLEMFQAGG